MRKNYVHGSRLCQDAGAVQGLVLVGAEVGAVTLGAWFAVDLGVYVQLGEPEACVSDLGRGHANH